MKKFAVVAGVIAGMFALIGAFFSGACVVYHTLKADRDISVTGKSGDEVKINARGRRYTETKLPENRHYGF